MDETKFIEKIGLFGIIGLFFCVFLSFTACVCLIVHVRYIYTYLFPLEGIRNCCRSISQKFGASHKQVPQTIHELEELVSGTRRAQKIARRVNQSSTLKEFGQITPHLNNFVVELRQEKIYRGYSVGLKNPDSDLFTRSHSVTPKIGVDTTFSREGLKVEKGPKKVTLGPA